MNKISNKKNQEIQGDSANRNTMINNNWNSKSIKNLDGIIRKDIKQIYRNLFLEGAKRLGNFDVQYSTNY